MAYQRVLFIAPASGLDVLPELSALYENGFQVRVMREGLTTQTLFDEVREQRYDIVHVAAHSADNRILLGNEQLDATTLAQLARLANAQLVFLNGCATAEIGQVLVDDGLPAAIVTLDTVTDALAKQTAQLFYVNLARTGDIHQAYRQSKPPVRGAYMLLTDGHMFDLAIQPIMHEISELREIWQQHDAEHDRLTKMIYNITIDLGALHDQALNTERLKGWFMRLLVISLGGMTLVQILLIMLERAK